MATYTVNTKRGTVTFESTLSLNEACDKLAATKPAADSFPAKLVNDYRAGRRFSPAQAAWLIKLAEEAGKPRESRVLADAPKLTKVIEMFDRAAANNLKWPAIVLRVGEQDIRLSRCGDRAKSPGAVNITDLDRENGRKWFGRIERDGSFVRGYEYRDDLRPLLEELADNPAKVATEYGKLTGRCCLCNRKLEDERSTAVGYGPVCAKHYGLPWGGVTETDKRPDRLPLDKAIVPPATAPTTTTTTTSTKADASQWTETNGKLVGFLSDWRGRQITTPAGDVVNLAELFVAKDKDGDIVAYYGVVGTTAVELFND